MGALALRRVLLQEEATDRLEKLEESERRFRLLVQGVKDYAIFMLDPEGRIASWNEGAERINGYTAEEILGKHFSTFYTEEDRAREHPQAELRVAAREGSYEEEGWRITKDGERFWAHVTITAIRDETGALIGYAKVTRDLTERRRHEGEREQLLERERGARQQVSTVLERITDAFFALDAEWRFTFMNAATRAVIRALLQRNPDEVLGLSFWQVVPQFRVHGTAGAGYHGSGQRGTADSAGAGTVEQRTLTGPDQRYPGPRKVEAGRMSVATDRAVVQHTVSSALALVARRQRNGGWEWKTSAARCRVSLTVVMRIECARSW